MAAKKTAPQRRKRSSFQSIRVKLILIILLLSIIPLGILTAFTSRNIRSAVMELELKLADQRIVTAQKEVMALIDQTFNGVDVLSRNEILVRALENPSEANIKAAKTLLVNIQEAFPAGETITFVFNTDGMQIVRADDVELNDISEREYAKQAIAGTNAFQMWSSHQSPERARSSWLILSAMKRVRSWAA